MSILRIDHYNLRANSELLDALRLFYCEIIGLSVGERPPLKSVGYWLYAGEKDVLHLSQAATDEIRQCHIQGTFDHVAFSCDNLKKVESQLRDKGITYKRSEVPLTGQIQLFLIDPAGNRVELNFAP
jgi:glyoxylase I family protein